MGIVHGDVGPWNLLIDPETADLKVFDFNRSARLGWKGDEGQQWRACVYDEHRNDVKLAIFTLYEIVTRDFSFREEYHAHELNVSMVLEKKDWGQHPDVRLEEGDTVFEYRQVLEDWVNTRRVADEELRDYKQAPESVDWPPLPQFPLVGEPGAESRSPSHLRQAMVRRGEPFLSWFVTSVCVPWKVKICL